MNRDVCEHFNPVDLPCAKCEEKRKSEALFLADELEIPLGTVIGSEVHRRAAAELRRLHAERTAADGVINDLAAKVRELQTQSDALLEALKNLDANPEMTWAWLQARAAITALRAALAEQRLTDMEQEMERSIESLKTALAEPEGGGNLPPPLQEPTVAENATTQQQLEDTPPSDYRRGYWDGFNIGKREGRIEAEDSLAEPVFEVGFGWLDDATKYPKGTKLYIAPPQRKPLTEEEIDSIWDSEKAFADIYAIARAVERAHGIV